MQPGLIHPVSSFFSNEIPNQQKKQKSAFALLVADLMKFPPLDFFPAPNYANDLKKIIRILKSSSPDLSELEKHHPASLIEGARVLTVEWPQRLDEVKTYSGAERLFALIKVLGTLQEGIYRLNANNLSHVSTVLTSQRCQALVLLKDSLSSGSIHDCATARGYLNVNRELQVYAHRFHKYFKDCPKWLEDLNSWLLCSS